MYSFKSPNRKFQGDDCWLVNKAKQLLWQNDLLLETPGEEKSQIRNNADKKNANIIGFCLSIGIFWSQNFNLYIKKLRLKYTCTQRKRQKGKRILLTLWTKSATQKIFKISKNIAAEKSNGRSRNRNGTQYTGTKSSHVETPKLETTWRALHSRRQINNYRWRWLCVGEIPHKNL